MSPVTGLDRQGNATVPARVVVGLPMLAGGAGKTTSTTVAMGMWPRELVAAATTPDPFDFDEFLSLPAAFATQGEIHQRWRPARSNLIGGLAARLAARSGAIVLSVGARHTAENLCALITLADAARRHDDAVVVSLGTELTGLLGAVISGPLSAEDGRRLPEVLAELASTDRSAGFPAIPPVAVDEMWRTFHASRTAGMAVVVNRMTRANRQDRAVVFDDLASEPGGDAMRWRPAPGNEPMPAPGRIGAARARTAVRDSHRP